MNGMVIIGAGECGTRAAFALREAGWSGPVTLIGTEPGVPYERPPLSKPRDGIVLRKPICPPEAFGNAGIHYLADCTARSLDPVTKTVTLENGEVLPYHRLLLATGATPRRLICRGGDRALNLRSHADAEAIFARALPGHPVAIIGAGLIGMELASVLIRNGAPVHVIDTAPAPLTRAVPSHFAAQLHQRHQAEGVRFHLGQGVAEIGADGVALADGTFVPADLTVAAIGVVPETGLAKAAGLATGNGILTDAELRSSAPDIFAAGDCAAAVQPDGSHLRQESWQNARTQAETAARNMLGESQPYAALPWFWSDQYDLGLQVAGQPRPEYHMVRRPLPGGELAFYLNAGQLVAAAGLGAGNSTAREVKLAEMLILAGARPDPALLADSAINLKSLLKSARAA
ncbi:ferredoxin reductase [Paracoccus kondratievae]|uniref:NAD(P)/FAD-dependent oxidoreductase n=1 Tax=Paracoccus kondratievae TaxID=135740 RepID=UPI0012666FD7|nr:FAD-dependent oxidoreductase [Paracoccus kondratievae]QFQ87075.1 ferredoxin reductase [Paracoccus kondratievae]